MTRTLGATAHLLKKIPLSVTENAFVLPFYGLCTKQLHLALAGLGDEKSIPPNLVIVQDKH